MVIGSRSLETVSLPQRFYTSVTSKSTPHLTVSQAYDAMAPFYDQLTAHHDYELWLNALLPAAIQAGLDGECVLDVGCGTGKSFEPLLARGWSVTACDASEKMLARARRRGRGRASLQRVDMRHLPSFGRFPLVLCLGDVLNHLTTEQELAMCFRGFKSNLAPGGVVLFDVNTLSTYRTFFAMSESHEVNGLRLSWEGLASRTVASGELASGRLCAYATSSRELLMEVIQRERHYRPETIVAGLEATGLVAQAIYGHGYDAQLEQPLDESRHTKAVFIAKHRCDEERR
jgi:SAM-dependent methyltransferase